MTDQHKSVTPIVDEEVDILSLLATLWEHKLFIAGITALFGALGVFRAVTVEPVYSANAVVQVESKSQNLFGMSQVAPLYNFESATTEIELLKSRNVIGRAVDRLGLDVTAEPVFFPAIGGAIYRGFRASEKQPINNPVFGLAKYAWGGESIKVAYFDVPEAQIGQIHTVVYRGDKTFNLINSAGDEVLTGLVGKQIDKNGYALQISELNARPRTQFELTKRPKLSTILYYKSLLSATEQGKYSGIIYLSLQNANPRAAEQILDEIAESYVRQNVEQQSAEASQSLEFLRSQLPEVRKNLEAAEKKLNEYQVNAGSVNISAEADALLSQVVDIEAAIADLQLQKAELERKYTQDHPTYKAWQDQLAEQQRRREELNERIRNLPETQQELLGLKRNLEVSTEIYTQMLNKIQELDIVRAGTVGNVRIVDSAIASNLPIKPNKTFIVATAIFFGGFLGVVIVLARQALSRGLTNPAEIEAVGIPVYASVPLSEFQIDKEKLSFSSKAGLKKKRKSVHPTFVLAEQAPCEPTIESLRSLRTSLHFAMMDANNKLMMITGPSPGVGKSFVSGNLAAVIAQAGQRVLLIDADMRKGYMHTMFGLKLDVGLSECLSGQASVSEAIKSTSIANLSLLTRGHVPPNPSELMMGRRLSELLEYVDREFDLVIIDTPPILAVTDAAIVGRQCSINMVVSRYGVNSLKELEITRSRFEQNEMALKGVIFNAMERKASSYGYGYYTYEYRPQRPSS